MRTNLFAAVLLIALPVTSLFAQQNQKVNPTQPKQVVSDFEKTSAAYIEQNKDMLVGFDEVAALNALKGKNKSALAISEIITGQKIKYIQNKMGIKQSVTPPVMNKLLGPCDNIGFDMLDFTNWKGGLGDNSTSIWGPCPDPIDSTQYLPGFSTGPLNTHSNHFIGILGTPTGERQVVLDCANCHDTIARNPITGAYEIPYRAPGGGNSTVRLGNAVTGAETERLSYKIDVTTSNSQLTYRYAVVYENPAGHDADEQPFFMASIKDSIGQSIGGCGIFCFYADPNDTSFVVLPQGNQYNIDQFNTVLYKKWTNVGVDLSPYVGQTVYLEFTTGDCALSGHWGYAYVDASCGLQTATISVCPNDTTGILIAPVGYFGYQWQTSAGVDILGETDDTLIVSNPQLGQSWIVRLESVAGVGCYTFLNVLIANYTSVPVQTSVVNLICNGVTTGSATAIVDSSVLSGPFSYQWFNSSNVAIPGPVGTVPTLFTNQAGTYWVKVLNAGGCGNFQPDTAIIQSIPDFTLSPTPNPLTLNLCLAQSANVNLNPILNTNTTITTSWNDFYSQNLNSYTTPSVIYTSNAIGIDTVIFTVISNFGCVKRDTLFVNVSPSYIAEGRATGADTLCLGDSTQLGVIFEAASPEICGITNLNCVLPVNVIQVGNGTTTNSTNILNTAYPSPFGNLRLNSKQQYLFRASELQGAGIKGGLINSIAFNVKTIAPVSTYLNYTIRMGCTNTSVASTDFDTALAQVYNPKPYNVIQGWNNIDLDKAYAWDGVSNLVIEICMDGNSGGTQQNCAVEQSITNFASTSFISNFNNPVCPVLTGAAASAKRPNIKFSICGIPADTTRYTYQWNPSNGLSDATISNPVATPTTSLYYVVTITDTVNGCSDTAGVIVALPPKNVSFNVDTMEGGTPLTVNFENTSNTNLISYFWDYADGTFDLDTQLINHTHIFANPGEYLVKLIGTNSNGCTDTAVKLIRVLISELRIPNVFTPNNDGKNDQFKLDAPGIDTFSGVIFNRWGKKVFEWSNPAEGWDGKNEKDGVYYYIITAKGVDGQEYKNNGHVTLTR